MTRIAIAAPTWAALTALVTQLDGDPHLTVVERSTRLEDVFAPHVVSAIDVALVSVDDTARLQAVLADLGPEAPMPPLVVLADPNQLDDGMGLIGLGLHGLLPRSATSREIAAALEAAHAGLVALTPDLLHRLGHVPPVRPVRLHAAATGVPLSPREREILALVAEGLGNKVIASRLGISEHTVKTHVTSIFGKLGAETRAEAVAIGARQGMILL